MKNKDLTIEVLKGITIILVVCGHVIQRSMVANGEDFFLNPFFKIIYTFHMPLFVFMSGYLMALSLNKVSSLDVFKSRCKSLLVPFIAWGIIGVLIVFFFKRFDHTGINYSDVWFVWFLSALFLLSGLLLFAVQLEKRWGVMAFVVTFGLVLLIPWNQYGGIYYVQWFSLFYGAGYLLKKHPVCIEKYFLYKMFFIAAVIIFFILEQFWTKSDYIYIHRMIFSSGNVVEEIVRLLYRYVIAFAGIFLVWHLGAACSKTKAGVVLAYIGGYSLDIYLIQRLIVEGFYSKLASNAQIKFDSNSFLFLYVFVPLVSLLFIGVCIGISKTLIRQNSLLNRVLLGGRG